MKVRNGFVSNSSSSSFILLATVKDIEKGLKAVDPRIREKIREWFIAGGDIVLYKGKEFIRNYGDFSSDETYGVMIPSPDSGGEDEELAFKEIEIFFSHLGPLSQFRGY